ncbi:MAG: Rieske 2Fe-2S domain-containing protein [Burkholderiales bacterium]|nr:Rieske 2Fe-2S domain-containing protein [Burkholderiales bacterium]
MRYSVDPDIARAGTLDPAFYADDAAYAATRERVFARTWQWLGDLADVALPGSLSPRDLLPGLLAEPLLLARDMQGTLRCLSNVCTHRANILVAAPCRAEHVRCGYHSRRFDLAGRMTFMPDFAGVAGFPSAGDDLPQVPFAAWAGHGFAALDPAAPLSSFMAGIGERIAWLPVERLHHDPARDRDYTVAAHWALYVENYLEGFHIPYVHPGLGGVVDCGAYATELFRFASLQVALAAPGAPAFAPPAGTADHGARVAAYYVWIFPNLMLNFYPRGLSVNLVQPEGPGRTRVAFRSYVGDAALLDRGAGGALDRVEREDEAIVEAVQRGVRARLYRGGRFSPTREQGVHHFHRLLCEFLGSDP